MRPAILSVLSVLGLACASLAEPVREVEVTPDPVRDGQQTFDVCLTPGETRTYDKLTIDCVLHQEFPKATTDQQAGTQVHEPAVFTYRRREVKMVEELDVHISFKVPMSFERLKEIYGATTFNTNYPVTVSRLVVTALVKDVKVWSFEVKAEGRQTPVFDAESKPGATP
jgi:hypothetical protein